MDKINFPIERINRFLDSHIFEVVTQPTHDEEYIITTNVKIKLTGVKNYISIGDSIPHVQYSLYILNSDEKSNMWYGIFGDIYGVDVPVSTTDNSYFQIRVVMNRKLTDFLKYFNIDIPVICTRVVNEVKSKKLKESSRKYMVKMEPNHNKELKFETVVKEWFKNNPNKYNLSPEHKERIIQKILKTK